MESASSLHASTIIAAPCGCNHKQSHKGGCEEDLQESYCGVVAWNCARVMKLESSQWRTEVQAIIDYLGHMWWCPSSVLLFLQACNLLQSLTLSNSSFYHHIVDEIIGEKVKVLLRRDVHSGLGSDETKAPLIVALFGEEMGSPLMQPITSLLVCKSENNQKLSHEL